MILTVLAFTTALFAQDQQSSPKVLNVSVDMKNKWVTGLTEKDFEVYLDSVSRSFKLIEPGKSLSTIGFLVDTSGSMKREKPVGISTALMQFLATAELGHEYFLVTFDKVQRIHAPVTSDIEILKRSLGGLNSTERRANTALVDALNVGIKELSLGRNPRKVLIVITDGVDNNSKLGMGGLREVIKRSDAIIYFVNLADPHGFAGPISSLGFQFMNDIAEVSGGRVFSAEDSGQLSYTFHLIDEELKQQYRLLLTTPENHVANSKETWHKIKVNVKLPDSLKRIGKPKIVTRQGFYSH